MIIYFFVLKYPVLYKVSHNNYQISSSIIIINGIFLGLIYIEDVHTILE